MAYRTQGPGGHWFTKKTWSSKISCQTPFNKGRKLWCPSRSKYVFSFLSEGWRANRLWAWLSDWILSSSTATSTSALGPTRGATKKWRWKLEQISGVQKIFVLALGPSRGAIRKWRWKLVPVHLLGAQNIHRPIKKILANKFWLRYNITFVFL
jgi:hypothetical protein